MKCFQDEEANAALHYHRANSSNKNTSRPPRRAHLDVDSITYEIFVERIIHFYDFNRAKLIRMEKDGEENDDFYKFYYL